MSGPTERPSWRRATSVASAALILAGCAAAAPAIPPSAVATEQASPPAPSSSQQASVPTATARATSFAWQRLGSIATEGQLVGIAASPAGYVVLELRRTLWFSPDGTTWTKATLPFKASRSGDITLGAWANEIVGGPGGFIAVGGYDHLPCTAVEGDGGPPPCARAPISWWSPDGLTWHSSLSKPIPADGSKLPDYSELSRAWSTSDGWDAAVEARGSVFYHGNTLLHSKDGLTWSRLKPAPPPEGAIASDVYGQAGIATSKRRLVWQKWEGPSGSVTSLATSADGINWARIPSFDDTNGAVDLGLGPDETEGGPWLLVGGVFGDESQAAMSWRSEDLATWTSGEFTITEASGARVWSLAKWSGGYLAVGTYEVDGGVPMAVSWLSPDGVTWSELPAAVPAPADGPTFVADGPAGVVGVGNNGDPPSALWLGLVAGD